MIIVGEKEENEGTLSIRKHGEGDLGTFTPHEFIKLVQNEIKELTAILSYIDNIIYLVFIKVRRNVV
jgi:threonyl-tRNA synthetase